MDFKWTLSRPGISLEFETGSIKEAIGMLEEEGTQISEVFGFTMGSKSAEAAGVIAAPELDKPAARRGRPPKAAQEAVAPEPLPVPTAALSPVPLPSVTAAAAPPLVPTTVLPPNTLNPADPGPIPTFLDRTAPPPLPTAPPVGLLGPKVVEVLQTKAAASPDGGQALADWLAGCGLTIKGKSFDEACRAVVMISDEKLAPAAGMLGIAA